jgi:hypothetical protein
MLQIKKVTRNVRVSAARACLRILMPNFYWAVRDSFNEFPRPSTKIIHRTFREKPLVGVEIGTGFGKNALSLLHELNIERLYCIDPFAPYWDGDGNISMDYWSMSDHTMKRLSKFKNVTFIRKFSSEACEELPKNLDFVYIDGNHGYDYVLADLRNYYPMIHKRGIMAGHDIGWPSVGKALTDFCKENIIKPFALPPDWIIIR